MNKVIEKQITDLLRKVGVTGEIEFTVPPKPEMGDLTFACFDLAKEWKKNPAEVAKEVESKVKNQKSKIIERVEIVGPYINFYLDAGELAKTVLKETQKKDFGSSKIGKNKKVLIEYPSENTHKEFHIGHLRNVCIGNVIVQLFKKSGYQMIPVNYINDFGLHVVKCLWGIERFHQKEKPTGNKQRWLADVYVQASNYIKNYEEEARPELNELQEKLENRDKKVMKLFEQTRQWSLDGFDKIHQELGAKFVALFLESEIKEKGQKIVDDLLKRKIAQVGEGGAVIVDLEKYNLGIALLRKSTGAGLYLTSDLALAEKKFKKFKVAESINITGTEQNYYFQQLFKILDLYGFKHKMIHVGYGLVNRSEGKMSSRTGNIILYEDLRDEIFELLKKETTKRHPDWSTKKVDKIVLVLTLAVLKFTMQMHEASKIITFNIKEATSFEGFSAPYILYVVARVNSLLRKSKIKNQKLKVSSYELFKEQEEKKLLMLMGEYSAVIEKARLNYNPSVVARYCFDLAQAFNDYYNKHNIINQSNQELTIARLFLCEQVKNVLVDALGLLTIETVPEM